MLSIGSPGKKYSVWTSDDGQPVGGAKAHSEFDFDAVRSLSNIVAEGTFFVENPASNITGIPNFPMSVEGDTGQTMFNEFIQHGIWQMLITAYSEQHSEGHIILDTMEDVYIGFTTGAMPITVQFSGYVPTSPMYNAKIDFITYYNMVMRGSRQQKYKIPVVFWLNNKTHYRVSLNAMEMQTNTEFPDFAFVSMSGTAFKYETYPYFE